MFTQKWRDKWGLREDPFTCEDADKDCILSTLDPSVAHWAFDRIFGNPRVPAPAIIFGEKGSGKSALRLITSKHLERFNADHPNDRVFVVEYTEYNSYMENFRRFIGKRADSTAAAQEVVKRWKVSDHLDCILSLGITRLVDDVLINEESIKNLTHKQKVYLLLMASLYYNSDRRTTPEALNHLNRLLKVQTYSSTIHWIIALLGTIVSILLFLVPIFTETPPISENFWHILGIVGLVLTWGWFGIYHLMLGSSANRANRAVKVLNTNPSNLKNQLKALSAKERREYTLPIGSDENSRYHLLSEFIGILHSSGFKGLYVLVDRIDEPSLLSARELMRRFIEKLLDIKHAYPNLV